MPILSPSSRNSLSQRAAVGIIYPLLSVLGLTMVVPFLITLTLSVSNTFDYQRYNVLPRYFFSEPDRFVKFLSSYFDLYTGWQGQMNAYVPGVPEGWSSWAIIGRDRDSVDQLANTYLHPSPQEEKFIQVRAKDYADFCDVYPMGNSAALITASLVSDYLADQFTKRWSEEHPDQARAASSSTKRKEALSLLDSTWKIPFTDFGNISFTAEMNAPMWQQSWFPSREAKFQSFLELKEANRSLEFMPGVRGKWNDFLQQNGGGKKSDLAPSAPPELHQKWLEFKEQVVPISPSIPYASRVNWRSYLQGDAVRTKLSLARTQNFDIAYYNQLAGTHYASWFETPFPVPANSAPALLDLWNNYIELYPLRLTTVTVTPALSAQFTTFLQNRFKTVEAAQQILGVPVTQWSDLTLTPEAPTNESLRSVWADFVKTLPLADKRLHSSEADFQAFMLARYGSLDAINQAWGTHFEVIEEAFPPFMQAYQLTFQQNQGAFVLAAITGNYRTVCTYLLEHANAVPVTLLLIALSILSSLTINPLAAYALSRFGMRGQDKIILFLLATSAFPAMISAIPGFLLMRDLGLLNTFFALILPGAANGMAIFILKGFFDSLPPELFEAATIDGAKEWQIFLHVTMPMVKPILAVNALSAFIAAYAGWEWALIVCQNQKMWTLAVWMYQANQWWAASPWITSAGFVIISIPTLIVFLTCQRIILQGIVIPQMK